MIRPIKEMIGRMRKTQRLARGRIEALRLRIL
jgi:hypothetical protein